MTSPHGQQPSYRPGFAPYNFPQPVPRPSPSGLTAIIAAVLAVILLLGGYFLLTGGVFETQRSVDIDVQLPAAEGQQ
mgnify:CR=1 FL=1